jgi:hypothetical protein
MSITQWVFYVHWRNSGNTPTKYMNQQTFRSISPSPLPADFDYIPDSDDGLGQTTIAPKAVIHGFHHTIPVDVLQQVKSGAKYVYIWVGPITTMCLTIHLEDVVSFASA